MRRSDGGTAVRGLPFRPAHDGGPRPAAPARPARHVDAEPPGGPRGRGRAGRGGTGPASPEAARQGYRSSSTSRFIPEEAGAGIREG